jgi:glutamate--cysteine ligase
METVADAFDKGISNKVGAGYRQVLADWQKSLAEPDNTPSAKMLDTLRSRNLSYYAYMMEQAEAHRAYFADPPLSQQQCIDAARISAASMEDQRAIEQSDTLNFDEYLRNYYEQYEAL